MLIKYDHFFAYEHILMQTIVFRIKQHLLTTGFLFRFYFTPIFVFQQLLRYTRLDFW